MNFETAVVLAGESHVLVKDSKAKIKHHLNTETRESYITYETAYFLQSKSGSRIQLKVSKAIAKRLVKATNENLDDLPECFQWSSLSK